MALIKTVRGYSPKLGKDCWLAENATIVGEVTTGDQCSFWFQSVIRGDVNFIKIGDRVNIQDGAIIHGTYEKAGTTIGNDVSIGHRAMVHGCTIEDNVLIGMGAIVMDHAHIPSHCLIAAGAVVLENSKLESGFIYAGVPAKKMKPISTERLNGTIKRISKAYIKYASWYKTE